MAAREKLSNLNWPLLAATACLVAVSIFFIHAATPGPNVKGQPEDMLARHILYLIVGVLGLLVVLVPHYRFLMRLSYPFYALCLGLLILVRIVGLEINGAQSWLGLGPFGRLQPSELMKLALILALSRYLMYRSNYRTLRGLIIPFAFAVVPIGLIILQPDLGTAMLFLPVLFIVLYAAGARLKHLALVIIFGIALLPVFWQFLSEHQHARCLAFLNPGAEEFRDTAGYHIVQSVNAIGSGGPFGKGFSEHSHNYLGFVPYNSNDFIFSLIGEQWGFFGSIIVIGLYLAIFLFGFEVAAKTREPFGRLLAVGVIAMLGVQVWINVAVTLGVFPTTGITLPLISYGGSSLLTCFVSLGLLLNVGLRRVPVMASDDFE